MITSIINDYFGYSVAVDSIWAAVGNPNSLKYNSLTSSLVKTGSVEVYKYNINTDTHDLKIILHRSISDLETILLATEYPGYLALTSSILISPDSILHTEYTGTVPLTADLDIAVDVGVYLTASEDGYGYSVDIKDNILVVGCPYFTSTFNSFNTSSNVFHGSGSVDIFDLSALNIDPYAKRIAPTIDFGAGFPVINGFINVFINVPPNQNFSYILLQGKNNSDPEPEFVTINMARISDNGGEILINTNYTDISFIELRVFGIVGTDPYLTTIYNPDPTITSSFGSAVSINGEWLAISSPCESGNKGNVFMYRKFGGPDGSAASWSLYQSITPPTEINFGDQFGHAIALSKSSGSYSGSLVVGSLRPSGSYVYEYEFDGTTWNKMFTLKPDNNTIYPLTFYPTLPLISGPYPNTADSFGYDVGIFKDTIIVGAPTDRHIYEFSGSLDYDEGAVYFFERCINRSAGYYLARKSYGNENTIVNNALGTSVDVYNNYAIAGCPKLNATSASICYIRGSLFQQNFCGDSLDSTLQGQYILFQQTTGSLPDTSKLDWDIVNVFQVKKHVLEPYRDFGFSCGISSTFIIIGSPMFISGSNRIMDLSNGTGSFITDLDQLEDLAGKAYIYNLKNLRENFYVGNVFYRNGKIVIMASGSAFQGLLLSNIDNNSYEYDLSFRSKLIVFEKQVVCSVDAGEFNVSTNPTAIVLPSSSFDINGNGKFDFQDVDVLLKYMMYKSTEITGNPSTDWSSSILNTTTNEELSVYNMYNTQFGDGTSTLFTSSYSFINNNFSTALDFNQDNKTNVNDMNILWKYFINRLNQKNYETYITPNSQRKFLSDILDFIDGKTLKGHPPQINSNFLDYSRLSHSDPTGSYLSPYVTSIGLYQGINLVAVAKLGSPIKITPDFPMNFIVKMDF